jgi:hypothetical protein
MKKLACVVFLGTLLSLLVSFAPAALAAPAFEDPQVCLNGNLLMVEPTTGAIEVWVSAGPRVDVDFNILNCGGNPSLPVLAPDHVFDEGIGKWVTVLVKTDRHTDVLIHWNGETYVKNSGFNKFILFIKKAN